MIDAIYFDGQSTRRHPVSLVMHKRVVAMRGEGIRQNHRLSSLKVSERLSHAPRILHLPDGGSIHVSDRGLDKMLVANGYRESRVVRWQRNWPMSLLALVTTVCLLLSGYQWGLPWATDKVAQHLPAWLEQKIGAGQLEMLDEYFMEPSELDPVVQARLRRKFAALKQPRGEKTVYKLEFRRSGVGPNAFALPNGVIVMTDELVELAGNDEAVLGVLGHELGHLQRRHSLRGMLQTLGAGALVSLWLGDASDVLVAAPTLLLNQKYSRDFERESDAYAIEMMQANGIPLSPMADLFEKMAAARPGTAHRHEHGSDAGTGGEDEDDFGGYEGEDDADAPASGQVEEPVEEDKVGEYFSSHPSNAERIARLRAADRAMRPAASPAPPVPAAPAAPAAAPAPAAEEAGT